MRILAIACSVALATTGLAAAQAEPASQTVAASVKGYSTSNSQLGTLLADPAAKAVLTKHIPQLVEKANAGELEQASGMTLKEIQDATKQYTPDLLSDQVLAGIDQDLSKLPPKN